MKGAQLGFTEAGSCFIGYVIHHAPGPMMAVWPTVEMAKRDSKQRIDPLIEESPALAERIAPARSRDSGNTILAKDFRGGVLVMTGANSAVGLRSMPVRYLFLDEVDGYPLHVEGEGDAITLAEARTRTFIRRKIFIVSTPTIAGASSIEREYEASDQRRYFVPCPHCAHAQWFKFERLRWERGQPDTAAYICEGCEQPIAEHHKTWMLEHGQWRATAPGSGRTAGFHLSSLYSPVGWREIAAAWESAVDKTTGSSSAIKTFKNTELGETWVEEGEAPDWQQLLERREDYRIGTVPRGCLLLVGGTDVQKDRIGVSVWAFGRSKEAWLVEHRVLIVDGSLGDSRIVPPMRRRGGGAFDRNSSGTIDLANSDEKLSCVKTSPSAKGSTERNITSNASSAIDAWPRSRVEPFRSSAQRRPQHTRCYSACADVVSAKNGWQIPAAYAIGAVLHCES